MPELPDLVHVEAGLRAALAGKRIAAARTGDPTVLRIMVPAPFPEMLVGRKIERIDRRGHFMRFALGARRAKAASPPQPIAGGTEPFEGSVDEVNLVVVVNAMLVGRYKLVPSSRGDAGTKKDPRALGLALTMEDAPELLYVDEKRMGKVYVAPADAERQIPVYGQLGLDVMSPDFTLEAFARLIARRRDQTRAFLMDKRALASIGNAYADEILFAARIHPKTFSHKLDATAVAELHAAIGRVLADAIAEIRRRDEPIDVKVRDFLKVRGRAGKPCLSCGTTIRDVRVGDGDACFCPTCQPETRRLFINWSSAPSSSPPPAPPRPQSPRKRSSE